METIGRCDRAISLGVSVAENSISFKKLKDNKNDNTSSLGHFEDGLRSVTLTNQIRLYYAT